MRSSGERIDTFVPQGELMRQNPKQVYVQPTLKEEASLANVTLLSAAISPYK